MWSKIKVALSLRRRLRGLGSMRISIRLTLVYTSILLCVLLLTSGITAAGIYFSLYHQASVEMEISVKHVMEELDRGAVIASFRQHHEQEPGEHPEPGMSITRAPDAADEPPQDERNRPERPRVDGMPLEVAFMRSDPMMPGVVLRITDEDNNIVFETDAHYPSIGMVQDNIDQNPPFWANKAMQVSTVRNMHLYYEKVGFEQNGHKYELHFFKTITAERKFLSTLSNFLLLTNLLGLILASIVGYFVSRRMLRPIRTLTQTAKNIEVTDLGKRIEVPAVKDELSELARTFNLMLDRIQLGFEQQRRFVSDASHELRTPVTVIRGYSDMLSRWGRQDDQALDEGISAIRSEAEDMQELIEKLLFLARADQNRQVLHRDRFELAELVDDVVKKTRMIAKKHTVELLGNEDGTVYVDQVTIKQMMRIFIENSLKYTPEGGKIIISSQRETKYMRLEIADTGIGIAKEDQKRVFERFFRVDSARTKAEGGVGGTGLGLSIARWIAEQHDIEIALESELGKGTKVILHIPLIA